MNPALGWALAALFAALAWQQYGWQGLIFAASAIVFWLLLQFGRAIRVMKNAAQAPVGSVRNAVMLHSRLKSGMTLLQVISLTKTLGRKVSDNPERFQWTDASGASVVLTMARGRCTACELRREAAAPPPVAP